MICKISLSFPPILWTRVALALAKMTAEIVVSRDVAWLILRKLVGYYSYSTQESYYVTGRCLLIGANVNVKFADLRLVCKGFWSALKTHTVICTQCPRDTMHGFLFRSGSLSPKDLLGPRYYQDRRELLWKERNNVGN